jgi:hypothetical protein
MKRYYKVPLLLVTAIFPIAASAYGPPPNVVTSTDANTAMGSSALSSNQFGEANTAVGSQALTSNQNGINNTAVGADALIVNVNGQDNTAVGSDALGENTTGSGNTALGYQTLFSNIGGINNTAIGADAFAGSYGGNDNTATGVFALYNSNGGNANTSTGSNSLSSNTTGSYNTAAGFQSLISNTTGYRNEADGAWALQSNTIGHDNTALGQGALLSTTSGSYNIGVGENAGYYVTTGNNNIEIGNFGSPADARVIRLGKQSVHLATYIAGVSGTHVTGSAVYVTSTGQLGVLASSERYKTAIAPMARNTEKLKQLRPVTFHLKTDPKGEVQYGLIAEEVAKVYPELVIRDGAGKIQGVRYEELAPMLLNEAQQQEQQIAFQAVEIRQLKEQLQRLDTVVLKLQSKDELVAQR